ncbi:hypothetical protein SISNIDRAFT_485370 [Sistotremastrum niveocremeum HHB9708]|uniref:Uncharacterized protein n=1 Tax=Sistotremastrum niveocremeum HHB9708 TaxID=1314777 RepID=A0A164V2V1_9AGAM|nr:hypothetical protein SISNIDRAFT_485370 [Sistotremastrum niveocremeum HHB9708]
MQPLTQRSEPGFPDYLIPIAIGLIVFLLIVLAVAGIVYERRRALRRLPTQQYNEGTTSQLPAFSHSSGDVYPHFVRGGTLLGYPPMAHPSSSRRRDFLPVYDPAILPVYRRKEDSLSWKSSASGRHPDLEGCPEMLGPHNTGIVDLEIAQLRSFLLHNKAERAQLSW